MSEMWLKIGYGTLWLIVGGISAYLSMLSIQAGANAIEPEARGKAALVVVGGAILRWLLMGILLYFSVRMHVIYALILVGSFSITRLVLIIRLSHKQKELARKGDSEI